MKTEIYQQLTIIALQLILLTICIYGIIQSKRDYRKAKEFFGTVLRFKQKEGREVK